MFKEKEMWIVLGLIVALLNPLFNNFANGQRYYAVVFVYMILYNYLLFYKMIDERQRKMLGQLTLVVGAFLGLLFISISLNRTSNGTEELGAAYQFVRYLGESMYNFNTDCYWITDYVGGEHSLKGFYTYLGINNTTIGDRTSILGVISNNFYTYIGAFVMDFGLFPTFVFLSLVALFFYILVRWLDKEINIGILIVISLYANMLLFGTTYFIYENGFIHFVWAIILSVILLFAEADNVESTETS
jgi:oligosaccharide repeat unit polymerase